MNILATYTNRHGDTVTLMADARGRRTVIAPAVPSVPRAEGGRIDRVTAAARMYGHGSAQHRKAAERFDVKL